MPYFIAFWRIATGIFEIAAAIRLCKEMKGERLLILGGLISVLFDFILVVRPGAGALAVIWLIATYAVVLGILLMILSFRVKRFHKQVIGS